MAGFVDAVCVSNNKISSTYYDLVFEMPGEFNFLPGQYLTCRVSPDRLNSYSIAGKVGSNRFGFLVDVKPGGPGSHFFANLKPGDKMPVLGPFGKFVLNLNDGAEEMIFLGTGSGVAPLKAMIEAAFWAGETRPMKLYFGLRYKEDILWNDYFSRLEAEHGNFKFTLCLSQPDESWQGAKGHITDLVKNDYPDASKISAYLCGGLKMIEEAKSVLASLGTPEERIYHEKFF